MPQTQICLKCIGRNIKILRLSNGLTQFELACDLNTDKSLISALERGCYKNITIKTLVKISNYFSVSLNKLLEDEK